MSHDNEGAKLIARALYEIRLLLGSHLGSNSEADLSIREAAHLAYALHNEALAIAEGRGFDMRAAVAKIKAIQSVLPDSAVPSRVLKSEL